MTKAIFYIVVAIAMGQWAEDYRHRGRVKSHLVVGLLSLVMFLFGVVVAAVNWSD